MNISTEREIRELEELGPSVFRLAADSSLDGIAILDLHGHIMYVNEARARMHGYRIDELLGKQIRILISPRVNVDTVIADIKERGSWQGESVGVRKDGSLFPIRQMLSRVDDPDKHPIALLSVTRDITAEQQAERRIAQAQQQYRELVENAIVGVYKTTVAGSILYINAAAARMFGVFPKEEALKRSIWDFYRDPEDRNRFLEAIKVQGQLTAVEIPMKTETGEPITVLVSAALGDDVISGMMLDITEKKINEEELKRSSQQLLELLNASREINSSLDTASVLRSLVQHAMSLVSASSGAVGLLVDDRMTFRDYNDHGVFIPVEYVFREGYGIPGWVMEHRMPYMTNDAEHDPQVIPHVRKALGFSRALNVPIISRDGRLLGCFELHNTAQEKPFSEQDIVLLAGFANQAAVTLNNATLAEELKKAADELKRSEETLRLVVEGSPDFFFYVHDAQGLFTYISPSVKDITGHDVEEWKSHYTRYLTDNPINEQVIRITEHMLDTGEVASPYPVEIFAKDGSRIMLEVYERPIFEEDRVVGIHGVARDVTGLRKAEAAERAVRQESEEYRRRFYRDTILSVTDGKLSICDPEEIDSLSQDPLFPPVVIGEPMDLAMARDEVYKAALKAGMTLGQADNLVLCVGEAATNALKHAGGGTLSVSDTSSALRVLIQDSGTGMDSLALPRLTLMRGFSTQKSLGMGYATILALADKVYLSTSPQGTRVIIEVAKQPTEPGVELAKLPDLW